MQKPIILIVSCLIVHFFSLHAWAESSTQLSTSNEGQAVAKQANDAVEMLSSLLELQENLKEQIQLSETKLENSKSEAEKTALQEEIAQLDRQLSETTSDFERIATGVESALFTEKKPVLFSWKDELTSLLEPAIKELKRFTLRARQKTDLKDKIVELRLLELSAGQAVEHLQSVLEETSDPRVQKKVLALQPEWLNIKERLKNKLELTERELKQLKEQDISLVEGTSNSLRTFFKNRGLYLIIAVFVFIAILLTCRVLYRILVALFCRFSKQKEQRSVKIRLLYIIFQVLSIVLAVVGLFFVLYLAEDWFLLSMAIIFFLGLVWTIRQGLPRLWQQGRLMLNIGAVRENERIILHGVPWKVASINVFCRLVNPSLGVDLRLPIEELVGLVSRPYNHDEPWFPCKRGDWVVVNSGTRARVVSLSHEQVEVVERGGRRVTYPTQTFLEACPANLSRNFRIRVPFGISYGLQKDATSKIPAILKDYMESRMVEEEYTSSCLNLQVEFFQANSSSLDLIIIADFEGRMADISKKIERDIQKWCVDCCTQNNWEIPFPQLTIHQG
ncbi:MAG: mechanosensitive ion channel [Proteobacteria bacterium]|nr:mechanosensitive ion channel [Pseudomonadota bacterium]